MVLTAIAVLTAVSVSEDVEAAAINVTNQSKMGVDVTIKAGHSTYTISKGDTSRVDFDNGGSFTITFSGNKKLNYVFTTAGWRCEFESYDGSNSTWKVWYTGNNSGTMTLQSLSDKETRSPPSVTGSMSEKESDGKYGRINSTTTEMQYSTYSSGPWTDCTAVSTAVNSGKYYLRYKVTGDYYESNPTEEVCVGPDKPAGGTGTVPYTGSEQKFKPSGFNENWVKIESGSGTEPSETRTYDATVSPTDGGCWSDGTTDAVAYTWTIVKATLTAADFNVTGNSVVYDGGQHGSDAITATLKGFANTDQTTINNLLSTNEGYVFGDDGRRNVGKYSFKLKITENDHFFGTTIDITTTEFKITQKAPDAGDFTVSDNEVPYDGDEHTATITLNSTKYTVAQPDKDTDGSLPWLSWTVGDAEKQINANETGYAIEVTVNGNSQNFSSGTVTLSQSFIITKRALTDGDFTISYSTGDTDPKFDTKEHKPTITLNPTYNTVTDDDCSWLTCMIGADGSREASKKDAGEYPITVYVADNTNFETNTAGISISTWTGVSMTTFTIERHTLTKDDFDIIYKNGEETGGTTCEGDLVYNQKKYTPVVKLRDPYGTYCGTSTGWLSWKVGGENSQTNANENGYAIVATISAENNTNFTVTDSLDIGKMVVKKATLTAADFTIAYKDGEEDSETNSFVYNMNNKSATAALNNGDSLGDDLTVKYFKGEATTGDVSPVRNVGTYKIKLYCDETTNYYSVNDITSDEWKITITQADLELVAEGAVYKIGKTYDGSEDEVKFTVNALSGDNVEMKIAFTPSEGSGSIAEATGTGDQLSFSQKFMHVADSGVWEWTASAGDNYNTLSSTDGTGSTSDTRVSVNIAKYVLTTGGESPNVFVTPYSEDYDGDAHAFEVTYTLVGQDAGSEDIIKVTYGTSSTSVEGGLDSIKEIYYTGNGTTNPGKTAYYKLSYCDGVQYKDYELPDVGSSTITIDKLNLTGKITLDEKTIEDNAEGMTATIQYNGEPRTLSATDTNHIGSDETVATYRLKEADITEEALAEVLKNMGEYVVEVTVSAKSSEDYSNSYAPFVRTVTVYVEQAAVEIVDFSYYTVTEGEPMTMTVIMRSVGMLESGIVVTYREQPLTTTCIIVDNNNGTYTATVGYDTSLGDIPSGTLQTISVEYPGDSNHTASGPTDYIIRMRSTGMPVIPEEGGQVPIDPDKNGIEVETPAGDIRFDLIDPPELGDGDTIIIDVTMRYASAEELVPDEESTIVLNTYGYVLHSNGDETPIKYRVTPSVDVEVPSGKKPVVTLYDTYGSEVGTPDVLTYTSDSATFQTDADGSLSMRIGVSFKSKAVPTDEPVVPVYPEETENTEEGRDYTLIIVVACVAITLEILAVVVSRRSRN